MMKRYIKYWPVFALIIFLTGACVWYRPLSLHQVLGVSTNETITTCKLIFKQWHTNNLRTKQVKLTSDEAHELLVMLAEGEYIRFYGNETYTTSEGDFFSIELAYTVENEEKLYNISITKHGLLIDFTEGNRKVYMFEEDEERTKILNKIMNMLNKRVLVNT